MCGTFYRDQLKRNKNTYILEGKKTIERWFEIIKDLIKLSPVLI